MASVKFIYNVVSKELVKGETLDQESVATVMTTYPNQSELLAAYTSGRLEFVLPITSKPKEVFQQIEELLETSNIEKVAISMSAGSPDQPTPISGVTGVPTIPGIIQMKKDGNTHKATAENFNQMITEGWLPSKKEYRDFPIVVSEDGTKVLFTCYPEEVDKFRAEGKIILSVPTQG